MSGSEPRSRLRRVYVVCCGLGRGQERAIGLGLRLGLRLGLGLQLELARLGLPTLVVTW